LFIKGDGNRHIFQVIHFPKAVNDFLGDFFTVAADQLGGVMIGLALNSVYYYRENTGDPQQEVELSDKNLFLLSNPVQAWTLSKSGCFHFSLLPIPSLAAQGKR
jgi:hypothetical protein